MSGRLTFIGAGHHIMLSVGVLEDTLGAEHFMITFAIELDFLVFMHVAHCLIRLLVSTLPCV